MNKVFKYYAIAPLTYGNIFSTDTNPKLKDIEIIYHGTKYTCDSDEVAKPTKKCFFNIEQLKKFTKNDKLANEIFTLWEKNIDDKGNIISGNLYRDRENTNGKIKLYIDETIETNLITIDNEKLDKIYIIPLETIDYLIQEGLEKWKFHSEDEKKLKYNEELLYEVKHYTFRDSFTGLIKSYKIGTDEKVIIDEYLNLEDVKKIYQGIKDNKTINIKTIEKTNNSYELVHEFKDKNKGQKWEKLKEGMAINPNFCLEQKDLGAYLQKKLDIEENIKFETDNTDPNPDPDLFYIKIPDTYLVDRFEFNFVSENDKKYIKADIHNKANLNYYDFKINPQYEDIAKKLKEVYNLDDSNYTLQYANKPLKKSERINRDFYNDIVVYLTDNEKNKDFLTDKKPKEIYFETIGENFYTPIYLNDFKNNELLKWAHECLKFIKKTNDISNFDIKFYKDKEAKEEIQIPDDNNINFEYKEDKTNEIFISISEKEKEKDKRDKEKDKEKNGEGVSEQSGESNKKKKKCGGCC